MINVLTVAVFYILVISMKFSDWVNDWFEIYKKPFVSHATLEVIRYCLKHVLKEFGERDIEDIRGIELQRFINSLSSTPNMQDKVRKYVTDIFEYAYRNRYIDFNPILAVKFKVYHFENTEPMNERQRNRFIKSLEGKPYKTLYLTYLYTGARRNELIAPGSFEVDFKKKLVFIHGTKTEGSDRVLPLFDKLEKILRDVGDYKKYFTSYKPNYVFLCLKRHLKRIGMPQFNVRSLRCTFSLMCYELGVRETTIQAWLGHTTTRTTKTYYLNKEKISYSKSDTILHEIDLINNSL